MKRNTNQHNDEFSGKSENLNSEETAQEAFNNEDNLTEESLSETEVEEPMQEVEKLQQEYDELNDSYLRLNAEFDNFRKRTIK